MTTLLPACLVLLLLASSAQGQVDVFAQAFVQCFTNNSSDILTCSTKLSNDIGASASNISLVLLDLNQICRYTNVLAEQTGCLGRVFKSCTPAEYHGLIATESGTRDAYQYLCDHRNEVNLACLYQKVADPCFTNAVQAYSDSSEQSGFVERTCSLLNTLAGCYRKVGASCPSHSVDVYDTFSRKSFPPACGASGLSVPTFFLLLGTCTVLLNKMAAAF